MRELVESLRRMGSGEGATWLIGRYPRESFDSGVAITAIPHLSWRRADQVRLAKHYLCGLPHASGIAYKAFASFMSIPRLLQVIEEYVPESEGRRELLFFYLLPVLQDAAKSDSDRKAIADFKARYA